MESLKSFHDHLRNLQSQGEKLIETRLVLNALFAKEETRLKQEGEVSILRALRCAIAEQLRRTKEIEASVSCWHSQANAVLFLAELGVTAMVSKGNRPSAIQDYLLRKDTVRQRPFGLVMVCISSKGLPDDARAVSISQLARESNRTEPEIVNRLQENGYLVFSEQVFSSLIDRLIADVREGKLRLPVSKEKLSEIEGLNKPKSRIKIVAVE